MVAMEMERHKLHYPLLRLPLLIHPLHGRYIILLLEVVVPVSYHLQGDYAIFVKYDYSVREVMVIIIRAGKKGKIFLNGFTSLVLLTDIN